MPILAFVHLAIAAFFGIHAVRNHRPMYWLMILFAFPALGSIVYFFAEYMPTLRHTRTGLKAARAMQGLVDPNRELREAAAAFDRTPTAYNRSLLARALLAKGQVDEAISHYQEAASGAYANDVAFLKGLSIAQLEARKYADAVSTLERLFGASPEQKTGVDVCRGLARRRARRGRAGIRVGDCSRRLAGSALQIWPVPA